MTLIAKLAFVAQPPPVDMMTVKVKLAMTPAAGRDACLEINALYRLDGLPADTVPIGAPV